VRPACEPIARSRAENAFDVGEARRANRVEEDAEVEMPGRVSLAMGANRTLAQAVTVRFGASPPRAPPGAASAFDVGEASHRTVARRKTRKARCPSIFVCSGWATLSLVAGPMRDNRAGARRKVTELTAATAAAVSVRRVPAAGASRRRECVCRRRNTLRGYQSDWRDFCAWCEGHSSSPLPAAPDTVASYIAECAGRLKPGSIQRRLNAIAEAHKAAGVDSPTPSGMVRNTMKGIRRTLGTAPVQKTAALTDDIRATVDAADPGLIGSRDRALILLGFAGAFRRSELVGLEVEDCAFSKDGLTVKLRRSKTDQQGAGRKIGIPYGSNPDTCPVRTVQAWLERADISGGPLFRSINRHGQVQEPGRLSGCDVARIVKKLADRAGLDASKYAGHSLRAGHATAAAMSGASERSIMNQTGHRSLQMVRRYIRDGSLFRENSAGKLGL
jgi:integrase